MSPPSVFGRFADALEHDWQAVARPSQLPPAGNWRIWLQMAGRGFGKTRSGAEWVRALVESGAARRIALVAPTAADARDVLIEGESGLLSICPDWNRPIFEPSKRRLTWPNGAIATTFSSEEPERLRGPQHDAAWCDELAAWRFADDAWNNLMLGLRLGKNPRVCVTTTPKPTRLIRDLVKRAGTDVALTRGTTSENAANLPAAFLNQIMSRYAGTRLGRQELEAELLEDFEGALWTREMIERARVSEAPELRRVVVAIDPSGSSRGDENDECGIIVAGVDDRGHGFVLDDLSARLAPADWARKAIAAYKNWQADRIIAETNFGGAMVEATLRSVDASVSFKAVTASRGKIVRAEPVSSFYEQGRVHHLGSLGGLEDQMCAFTTDFSRASAGYSPDRVDALVWALSELMSTGSSQAFVDYFSAMAANGGKIPEELLPTPQPTTPVAKATPIPLPPAPTMVTLHAPQPFAAFQVDKNRYAANGDGLVSVEPEHVEAMVGMGCWPLAKPEEERNAIA
jgi:phage terminase large subunit-like protein